VFHWAENTKSLQRATAGVIDANERAFPGERKRKFKNALAASSEIRRKSGSRSVDPPPRLAASCSCGGEARSKGANSTVNKAGPSNYRRPSVKSSIPSSAVALVGSSPLNRRNAGEGEKKGETRAEGAGRALKENGEGEREGRSERASEPGDVLAAASRPDVEIKVNEPVRAGCTRRQFAFEGFRGPLIGSRSGFSRIGSARLRQINARRRAELASEAARARR
jgi:hypothetical protein